MTDTPDDRTPDDEPPVDDAPTAETASGGSGPATGLLVVAAVVAFVVVGAIGWAIASATGGSDDEAADDGQAAQPVTVEGESYALPVLEPVAVGGFVRPDVAAAADEQPSPGVPPEGIPPDAPTVFELQPGQEPSPDLVAEDPDAPEEFPDLTEVALRPPPTVVVEGTEPPAGAAEEREIDPVEAGLTPPDETDGTTPDGSEGGEPGGTAGGEDEDPVVLTDECADDEPPEDCGDGFGGTIRPLGHETLVIRNATGTISDRCADSVETDERDRVPLMIVTNERGDLVVEYTADGSGDDPRSVEVTTPDSEESFADAHEDVQTCVLLDRLEDATHYEVTVSGDAVDGGGPALPWTGLVAIPDGADRPPVTITPASSRTLEVYVPAAEAEAVEVWTIPRDAASASRCSALEEVDETGEPVPGRGLHPEVDRIGLPSFGMWDPQFDTLRQHDVHLYDEQIQDLCVIWYRDLEPGREVVERASWVLWPPAHPDAEFVATDFVDAAGRGAELAPGTYEGVIANVDITGGGGICSDAISRADLEAEGEIPFCSFEVTPRRSFIDLHYGPYGVSDGTATGDRYALELRSSPCIEPDVSACTEVYYAAIPAPGEGRVYGTFVFEVRYGETPIRGLDWVVSSTGTFSTPEEERPDVPRLDVGATRVEMDPADPFRVLLHWQADRPIAAASASGDAVGDQRCFRASPPDAIARHDLATLEGDHGTIPLEVCPGTGYEFEIRLEDEAGNASIFSAAPAGEDRIVPEYPWPGGRFETDLIDLRLRLELKTRYPGLDMDAGRLPLTSTPLFRPIGPGSSSGWWDVRYRYLNVEGNESAPDSAGGYYHCDRVDSFDYTTEEPVTVQADARLDVALGANLYRFTGCGLWGNVPDGVDVWANWGAGITHTVGVGDLLFGPTDGWLLQSWLYPWQNVMSRCNGQPWAQLHDQPDTRSAQDAFAAFEAERENPTTPTEPPEDWRSSRCLLSQYRVAIQIFAEPPAVGTAVGGVETPAED